MIKGNIEIFQSYGDEHKSLYKGSNMVVDGFRKTIADVMTYMPNPSATPTSMEPGVSSVSSYQIQAMSLGSAKEGYSQRDSRFWYSGMATSAENYQLLPVTDNAVFEMWDCYSSIGFNQWKYDNQVDANLLVNPTLNSMSGWNVNFLHDMSAGMVTRTTDITSEGEIDITKFELVAGQEQVTLRQRLPEMKMGGVYTFYTNGKAHNATMDIRISRGKNDVPLEYYDFSTERFVVLDKDNKDLYHTIKLKNFYEVDEFRCRLRGNERDQAFQSNNEYFVEYIFPSVGFIDESFAPWDFNYVNPHINIIRLEVCDERHQILRNPNFLEHQSLLMNNDFDILVEFPSSEVTNADGCAQAGLYKTPGWRQLNPLARDSQDPGNREDNSHYGAVFPLSKNQQRISETQLDGVALYSSSIDLDSSGAAQIEQTFNLGNEYKNHFAFASNTATEPELLAAANGQYDNNRTLMLSFDTMVSGEAAAADCGTLQVTLRRDSDGYEYSFTQQSTTLQNDIWVPNGNTYNVSYDAKDTWYQKGVQVILPADAQQETYTISIAGTGRSDGTNGFCYYLIRNFSFGPLAGWRTYVYDHSGIAKWSLSSTGARVQSGKLFSGLTLSATRYDTLAGAGTAKADIDASIDGINVPAKTQLVQNFVGLEPTKTYRLAVKGTYLSDTGTLPNFKYSLKAKARTKPQTNNYNILSTWMRDGGGQYSATNTPTNLNPYSTNTNAHRATHPFFSKSLNDDSSTPLDWGLWVTASGSSPASSVTSDNLAANAGEYTLSMKVFNSQNAPSYFVLSSTTAGNHDPTFFNWETAEWDSFVTGTVPAYRNSASGAYFLPLPSGANTNRFTTYTYPNTVTLPSTGGQLREYSIQTPDGLGSRGKYRLTAAVYGPNAETGSTLISDLALKGPGLETNVDIWKELYYNFTAGSWQPEPVQAGDYYSENTDDTPESFISCPVNLIGKMALFGLDRDTEYQINIIDAAGGIYTIHDISLQDVSFVSNSGRSRWIRDASIWTSEPYGNFHYDKYDDGAVFKLRNENNNSPVLTNTTSPSAMTSWANPDSIMFRAASANTGDPSPGPIFVPVMRIIKEAASTFAPWLTQNFTLGEYNLKGGDMFAIGLEGICLDKSDTVVDMSIAAKYNGVRYQYNPTSREWLPGKEQRTTSFTLYNRVDQLIDEYYADAKTWNQLVSSPIVAPPFGPNTKITASFAVNATDDDRNTDLKDFKVYRWTDASSNHYHVSGATFNFPEFPSPADATLQSTQPSGHPGQLGQFLNRINFFNYYPTKLVSQATASNPDVSGLRAINNPMSPSITGEKTLEEAVAMGAYLPSAGLFFGSGTYGLQNSQQSWGLAPSGGLVSGVLNQMGVVNSDGYIYRHPHDPTNNDARDASAGFIVSSYQTGAGTYAHKTIRYILKLHKDDWRFLDYYMGGIGALGLHALDYKKTYNKLGTAYQISGTGASYSPGSRVGLYKIADPSRNPVFNLTNKKVTFPPGLKIDYNNTDHITIIWDINY